MGTASAMCLTVHWCFGCRRFFKEFAGPDALISAVTTNRLTSTDIRWLDSNSNLHCITEVIGFTESQGEHQDSQLSASSSMSTTARNPCSVIPVPYILHLNALHVTAVVPTCYTLAK
jgi:hypothetical protein